METNFSFNYYEIIKNLSILHYAHPKPIVDPFFFEGTVSGDVKTLDEEVFPSILNEINDFPLLYAFKCYADYELRSLEDKIVRIIV